MSAAAGDNSIDPRLTRIATAVLAVVALLGILLVSMEGTIEGEPVPSYIWTPEGETSTAENTYADHVGIPPDTVQLDAEAVAELERRGIDPCPTVGAPSVPTDLAARVPVACDAFDGHGGYAYVLIVTVVAGLGAVLMIWRRNRVGLYLALIVLFDVVGAVAGAYAIRALVVEPGSLPFGSLAALVASVTWIPMLVVLVPLLILTIPTGRLLSQRWRWAVLAISVVAAALTVTQVLHPLPLGTTLNPIAAPWSITTANTVFDYGTLAWMATMVAALVSLAMRAATWSYRRLRQTP